MDVTIMNLSYTDLSTIDVSMKIGGGFGLVWRTINVDQIAHMICFLPTWDPRSAVWQYNNAHSTPLGHRVEKRGLRGHFATVIARAF